mmetsp:Transcript_11374/g.17075  ORF Transcript_11374/g.17075 Transcript_11374/m.17075 type:complete len:454 (+) Transcript_11374:313-1674(+)|eukprot:CAMPEP_0196815140 /NCGR_PEP_ID=MMETSP1362-20130617/48006_1 /TAXON_ID=163516 /ORGANISM="Leptocylindrus danicus, Strain CCMP1856" /LENGTH=453 /DNA_ID=CAMNT_0042191997 /DNA_START=261 /DNA_END=1622 /DNA_ORIENTATION=+
MKETSHDEESGIRSDFNAIHNLKGVNIKYRHAAKTFPSHEESPDIADDDEKAKKQLKKRIQLSLLSFVNVLKVNIRNKMGFLITIATFLICFCFEPWHFIDRRSTLPKWPDTIEEAKQFDISPLRTIDYEYYTIRMNTWRRNEQLIASIDHHSQCEGVKMIQVVWCDEEREPPQEVLNHVSGKVVVEMHTINSLNERFNLQHPPPTLGILSMDDDVIRPCFAIDSGFFKWTEFPDRMVGFDTRLHVEKNGQWAYGYLSASQATNSYSIVLPRYSFIHRDYLYLYYNAAPRMIIDTVTTKLNCEDIAMSFFVSSLLGGKIPLLADYWAVKTQIKLYTEKGGISSSSEHKLIRDKCVDDFAIALGIKYGDTKLTASEAYHGSYFGYGDEISDSHFTNDEVLSNRKRKFLENILTVKSGGNFEKFVHDLVKDARSPAEKRGLIKNTSAWRKRFAKS